jgi:hypothetical protein
MSELLGASNMAPWAEMRDSVLYPLPAALSLSDCRSFPFVTRWKRG